MTTLLLMSNDAKEKKVEALENVRGKVNLDHLEGEESDEDNGNAIVILKSKPSTSSLKSGSIDKFYRSSTIEEYV
jgi:hypothetical protein